MAKVVNYLTNYLTGLEGEPGIAYSYILSSNGLFLRAKNQLLSVTICIAEQEVRGLAPLEEEIKLLHGKIPLCLLELALSILCINPEKERYVASSLEGEEHLKEPVQEAGPGHVNYETIPNTVLDIHSHTGKMPAVFSGIDDHDEQGFMLYGVVADLRNLFPTVALRLGCYGYFIDLEKGEVFE